ncbi:unnamed protein product [Dovyalis caffra]|uniref:Uncharacterized protein n=1 Tax=Dovyalis caffra TaxID=77055 RepID=A0AAV1RFQ4_9ROSI|nr:unnamed protein product [Dovyalis caffra]
MSASIEALAMAGVDYHTHNMKVEEWEQEELELPPAHLLAEEEEEEKEVERNSKYSFHICRCWLSSCPAKDGAGSDYAIIKLPRNVIQKYNSIEEAMSIEALAMAGVDYADCGINLEVWEQDSSEQPPLHPVGEQNSSLEIDRRRQDMLLEEKLWKAKILEWAKAIAAMHVTSVHQLKPNDAFS